MLIINQNSNRGVENVEMKKRIINTSLRDYEKDLGMSELEKKIKIMKKQLNKELGCLYAFIDIKYLCMSLSTI